ncbi:MAG: hypothetical protein K0R57_174 [Paenibacillaceae bacterium]|jgi:DNA-binding transcriptional ArsR family regulator|nr:hypothetical protein [Paenibacillaceae bacterium]
MQFQISRELDPVFETAGLLYISSRYEDYKKNMIAELTELGTDGEQFYHKHLKVVEKYIQAFTRHRSASDQAGFFFGVDSDPFVLALICLICENRDWMTSLDGVADEYIRFELLKALHSGDLARDLPLEQIRTLEDTVAFLKKLPIQEGSKWRLLSVLHQPKQQLRTFIDLVAGNLPAYHKAVKEVEKPLEKLLQQFAELASGQEDKSFFNIKKTFSQDSTVNPTLIMPVVAIIFEKMCYYGLFTDSLLKPGRLHAPSREALQLKLKALSDKSKLQILSSLKVSPKYNLEIAEQLGLTAATMSHHMNVLLACGLVSVDKRDGRVYYHLQQENIRQFISDLEHTLL